jgi:hypothetical protein
MTKPAPTLNSLNYDGNPPRCGSCVQRFIRRFPRQNGRYSRQMMCALTQSQVHTRGVCDAWRGVNGEELAL